MLAPMSTEGGFRTVVRRRRGEYGIDGSIWGLVALGASGLLLAGFAVSHAVGGRAFQAVRETVLSLVLLVTLANYLYATRYGKFALWADLLEALPLRGDERVLDMGCGRGAVLTLVAHRVPRGRVVGLDLWRAKDQSGNAVEATRRNLVVEGVNDRCVLETADMRAMPFPDRAFDLVLSSLAIHNIPGRRGRLQAIDEAVRVLKPRGRLVVADLGWTASYARRLREQGMTEVDRRHQDWRFWYGGPWLAMVPGVVTATKPL